MAMRNQLIKQWSTALAGLTFSLLLIAFGSVAAVSNVYSSAEHAMGEVINFVGTATYFAPLRVAWETNHVLYKRISQIETSLRESQAKIALLSSVEKENRDLKASLASISASRSDWIAARFLYSDTGHFIDRGKADGLESGDTLMFRGMYIGRVSEVEPHVAAVETVWSYGAKFGVRILPADAQCVLQITPVNKQITCLSRIENVNLGDQVVILPSKSGVSAGLLVGVIENILTKPADAVSSFSLDIKYDPNLISVILVQRGGE